MPSKWGKLRPELDADVPRFLFGPKEPVDRWISPYWEFDAITRDPTPLGVDEDWWRGKVKRAMGVFRGLAVGLAVWERRILYGYNDAETCHLRYG